MGTNASESIHKSDLKKGLRFHQISEVNELRWLIEQVSGFTETTRGYWLILQMSRFIRSRFGHRYISNVFLARISWMLVQLLCGFVSSRLEEGGNPVDDDNVLKVLQEYLDKIIGDDVDFDAFTSQLFRPYSGKHLGRRSYPGLDKYLFNSVLSNYPCLPARRGINRLAGVMTLTDCYDRGYFLNVRDMWNVIGNEERVELKHRVPRTIALQFRLMALFCECRPEDMLSICVMLCWEKLGRLLLRKCKSITGLTDVFDALTKELASDQSGIC